MLEIQNVCHSPHRVCIDVKGEQHEAKGVGPGDLGRACAHPSQFSGRSRAPRIALQGATKQPVVLALPAVVPTDVSAACVGAVATGSSGHQVATSAQANYSDLGRHEAGTGAAAYASAFAEVCEGVDVCNIDSDVKHIQSQQDVVTADASGAPSPHFSVPLRGTPSLPCHSGMTHNNNNSMLCLCITTSARETGQGGRVPELLDGGLSPVV